MPIIAAIMKIIDQRETQKKNIDRKDQVGETKAIVKAIAKWFCCAFKIGFLQLIFKASVIFKSNLELALSIILKQWESY